MVSLRRRKLLGHHSEISEVEQPRHGSNENVPEKPNQHMKSMSVHPMSSVYLNHPNENYISELPSGSSDISSTSSSKEERTKSFSASGQEIKRRKRYRRKHFENQEPCIMRGVYFKNMKWQAAIKVDKKQIHLGTVESQEEAAHLYDRAAFLCGREPNFELSEEEKRELRKIDWDEYVIMTRDAIFNKKRQRRLGAASTEWLMRG